MRRSQRRFAARYDRWQATARFPRLLKEFYAFSQDRPRDAAPSTLRRFDPATRRLEPVEWPEAMSNWREQLAPAHAGRTRRSRRTASSSGGCRRRSGRARRRLSFPRRSSSSASRSPASRMAAAMSYSLLMIDRDYVDARAAAVAGRAALRPSGRAGERRSGPRLQGRRRQPRAPDTFVFQSTPSFAPALDAQADATADLFQVRTQDFLPLAAEVRRFTAFVRPQHGPAASPEPLASPSRRSTEARPLSIVIQPGLAALAGRRSPPVQTTPTKTTETRLTSASRRHTGSSS